MADQTDHELKADRTHRCEIIHKSPLRTMDDRLYNAALGDARGYHSIFSS